MDDLSLDDLLSGLQAAQDKKSAVRLSERNIVELVVKLKQLGFFGDDLLHTSNGREYITREKLQEEVAKAVEGAGGRLPMVDLPSILGVDLAHCERAAEQVVSKSKSSIILAQGELLTTNYFDSLAEDENETLQSSGVVVIGDVARRTGLGVEMLQGIIRERIGKIIKGRLEGGVIYTDAYLARIKAQLRGALRASLAPVSLATIRKDLGIENLGALSALVPSLAEELLKDGAINGKLQAGGTFVPASFARSQQDFVRSFFQQNGYVSYDMAAKYGMTNVTQTLAGDFPDGQSLTSVFVSPSIVHQVEAAVEEAVHSSTWCDAITAVPAAFTPADAAQLLAKSPAAKGDDVSVLSETCAVSKAFIDALKAVLCEEAKSAAQKAHESKKAAGKAAAQAPAAASGKAGGGKKGGSKSAPALAVDEDSDDDWDMGKGKGKKGKGGKKGGKGGASTKSLPQQAQQQKSSSGGGKGGNKAASDSAASLLSLEALEQRILELHPDTEGAGADADLPASLAAELRPAVVAEYERALSDIFTAGAERRRRLHEAASARLESCYQQFLLYKHGAELFDDADEATAATLKQHLMRSAAPSCVDALLHFLAADVAEEEQTGEGGTLPAPEAVVSTSLPPSERKAIVQQTAPEAREAVAAAVTALTAAPQEFVEAMEAAADAAGLRVRQLDKKTEGPLVQAQVATLKTQIAEAVDGPTLLAGAVPLLIAKHRGRCVSLPGKALAGAVQLLKDDLDEEQHSVLTEFHGAVVESLKGAGADSEAASKLESLTPKIRELFT